MLKIESDGTITYKGEVVVTHVHEADKDTVTITLTYETPPGDWVTPLCYLAIGLQTIEPPSPPVVLKVATRDDDIEERFDVPRFLIEKIVKGDGYIWEFHKTDTDPWPSQFHGHDYEQGLKIDAITGNIFDAASRQKCARLNSKSLSRLHNELLNCKDLKDLANVYLPP